MYDDIVTSSPCISHTVPASKSDSIVPPQKRQRQSIPSRDFSSSELGKLAATAASKLAVLGWDRYFKTAQQPLCLNDGFSSGIIGPRHSSDKFFTMVLPLLILARLGP